MAQLPEFVLSSTLQGHKGDVRGSCASPDDVYVVTGSRDNKAVLWQRSAGSREYEQLAVLEGHSRYIMSVAWLPASDEFPQGLVATASLDKTVLLYDPLRPLGPVAQIAHHSDAVCRVQPSLQPQHFLTSSWDNTAVLSTYTGQEVMQFKGHQAAVWDVLALSPERIVTASADKTLKLWQMDGQCVATLTGHTDVVRGLAALSEQLFLSCANDGTVYMWSVAGEALSVVNVSQQYVYSIAALSPTSFVTCGEDSQIRVWTVGKEQADQTIALPCGSLWHVYARHEALGGSGDVIVSCDDTTARIFTRHPERQASPEDQAAFDEVVQAVLNSKAAANVGAIKKDELPGREALSTPGRREGQNLLVNHQGSVEAYTWSSSGWQFAGQVTDAKEADYTFTVDLDGRNLKLEYNNGEEPYDVAQKFIHTHQLEQGFLDQIAGFIIQNANVPTLGQSAPQGNPDPFTRSNKPAVQHFPNTNYVTFGKGNPTAAVKKLSEVNASAQLLTEDDITTITTAAGQHDATAACQAATALANVLPSWPQDQLVPVIDLLRLITSAQASGLVQAADWQSVVNHLLHVVAQVKTGPLIMLTFRLVANLVPVLQHSQADALVPTLIESLKAGLRLDAMGFKPAHLLAMATTALNTSTFLQSQDVQAPGVAELEFTCLQYSAMLLAIASMDAEGVYRTLVALGTLIMGSETAQQVAAGMDELRARMQQLSSHQEARIQQASPELLQLLVS